jgi:retron-type reverse transcriptase
MKTFEKLYSEIISLPNLYRAFEKAKKGKKKQRTIAFEKNLHENLWKLHCELLNKTYNLLPYFTFYVTDYKKRKIMCPNFRDQVIQHAIFNYLEQIYEKVFIYDSYACRKDKGTHKACLRLKKFICKYSSEDYFMKCDITKYFYSIDHQELKLLIRKKIKDENVLWLIDKIIDSHSEESLPSHINNPLQIQQEKGIPIGNLMSQLFANIYLNELDYFIKHEIRIKHYIRYVDDFVILGKTHKEMRENLSKIQKFLSECLFLKLEEKKVQINKISFGVDFAGYVCFKRFVRVRTRNYRRFMKKFKVKVSDYYFGELTFEKICASFISYMGHLSHTNSQRIKEKLEIFFVMVIVKKEAVQRGGNWNNGANAGPFCANLNNAPSNVNNNIGFRCCSEHGANIMPSRRHYCPYAQMQLQSSNEKSLIFQTLTSYEVSGNENRSRNKTAENAVISAMK